ncbi:MAG: RDD family protein [bacterium]
MTNRYGSYDRPSFLRRLGIAFYDVLLSVSFVLVVASITQIIIFAINGGDAAEIKPNSPLSYFFFVYYLFLGFVFFGWFWAHGGQTLGMRAWKVKVANIDGSALNWQQAFTRYALMVIFSIIGLLWVLFDKERLALHDRFSKTQLIYLG